MSVGIQLIVCAITMALASIVMALSMLRRGSAAGRVTIGVSAGLLFVSAVAIFVVAPTVADRAVFGVCRARLAMIGRALSAYHSDHGEYPHVLENLVHTHYLTDDLLKSPLKSHIQDSRVDYVYVQGLRLSDPGHWPLVFDTGDGDINKMRNVLLLSKDARTVSQNKLEKMLNAFNEEFKSKTGRWPKMR